jgi:hypothetical protein
VAISEYCLGLKSGIGSVELTLLPNEPYEVAAELTCRHAGGQVLSEPGAKLRSDKVHVSPRDEKKELLLTIPTASCPNLLGKTLLTDQ